MNKIPNPEEDTSKVFVKAYGIEIIGEVSPEQINEIKANQLKILELLQKEKKKIKEMRRGVLRE